MRQVSKVDNIAFMYLHKIIISIFFLTFGNALSDLNRLRQVFNLILNIMPVAFQINNIVYIYSQSV